MVQLEGGPVVIEGKACDFFVTVRYIRAKDDLDAGLIAMRELRKEFKSRTVKLLGEIQVKWSRPLMADEKIPDQIEVHFVEQSEDPSKLFESLRTDFLGDAVERLPDGLLFKTTEPDGFNVSLEFADHEYTVTAKTWHGHYSDRDQAEWCVRWLFSPYYRVVEEMRDGEWIGSWLERWMPQGWDAMEPVLATDGLELIDNRSGPFEIFYSQQAVAVPPSYAAYVPGAVLDERDLPPGSVLGITKEVSNFSLIEGLDSARSMFDYLRNHSG